MLLRSLPELLILNNMRYGTGDPSLQKTPLGRALDDTRRVKESAGAAPTRQPAAPQGSGDVRGAVKDALTSDEQPK